MPLSKRTLLAGCVAFLPATANAQKLTTLYVFQDGLDGGNPSAPVLFYDGNLYGTTWYGGANNAGTVFEEDLSTGKQSTLYSFPANAHGTGPMGSLIESGGYLYGTTAFGNAPTAGTAFKLDIKTGQATTIHTFSGTPDGANPYSGLVLVGGMLYGTTDAGGSTGSGTIYSINPKTGAETVLYSFLNQSDGSNPDAGVIKVGGSLYGTTLRGGAAGEGLIFQYNVASKTFSTLYSFGGGVDGGNPNGLFYYHGALYGTSAGGPGNGSGNVFKFEVSSKAKTIIYTFTGGADGGTPDAGVIYEHGQLYGTTRTGGLPGCGGYGCGTVFAVNSATGAEKVLFSFSSDGNGSQPDAPLIDNGGTLYGTTFYGGSAPNLGHGTIFKLKP